MPDIELKFDHNQPHQIAAINSTLGLFEGLPQGHSEYTLQEDIVPNVPSEEVFDDGILLANLQDVQEKNGIFPKNEALDTDDGAMLEGVSNDSWRYPIFTVEMETGTGKTYVYIRSIYELKKRYGFRKFIIVVPSVAIYEGVVSSIDVMREHFKTLYNNEYLNKIEYDGEDLTKIRDFATSQFLQVLIITRDAFNKDSNKIYKETEKLPGTLKPFEYIQATRPILILDEPQNYFSETSRGALRTLKPLLALQYSATPKRPEGTIDGLFYKLDPVNAFRQNLVKKVQVYGVTEEFNFNENFSLALHEITPALTAKTTLVEYKNSTFTPKEFVLRKNDDLFEKTKNPKYADFIVEEINRGTSKVIFKNGYTLSLKGRQALSISKEEIFKKQIEETIDSHITTQNSLKSKNIKVLSLFFVDRVSDYTGSDAIIRRLFDEVFEQKKKACPVLKNHSAEAVRRAYFAQKKGRDGKEQDWDTPDTEKKTKDQKKAEQEAYKLIMKSRERLLSFDEKVSFIFAHSALKEGWDNPNVFQICTLRNTKSERQKRQTIGRGMRLCVNQAGERLTDTDVNILTVVANESYESFCSTLQSEYAEAGDVAPQKPTNARRSQIKRNDAIFHNAEFKGFWEKLAKKTSYEMDIDVNEVVEASIADISNAVITPPQIFVRKGKFAISTIEILLESATPKRALIQIKITETEGHPRINMQDFCVGDDLSEALGSDERLRGHTVVEIIADKENPEVYFGNSDTPLTKDKPIRYQTHSGQQVVETSKIETLKSYPIFNLVERAQRETHLTRATLLRIFTGLRENKRKEIFTNPEGFATLFISSVKSALADNIAKNIKYQVSPTEIYDKNELFLPEMQIPQKELIHGSSRSLYDMIQVDSDVEKNFVEHRLNKDDNIIAYFKFPPKFKVSIPEIIGKYNPDWGIIRKSEDGKYKLELVRETKGSEIGELQHPNEIRKILCAEKHFGKVGVDYRRIGWDTPNWWEKQPQEPEQLPTYLDKIKNTIEESLKYVEYLPIYSLQAAAGKFGNGEEVREEGWIKVEGRKLGESMFVAKVVGHSMEPTIPDGSYCIFAKYSGGSRDGIVLAQHHSIEDPDTGGSFTIKYYHSEKIGERHTRIILKSFNKDYPSINIPSGEADDFKIIAMHIKVLGT